MKAVANFVLDAIGSVFAQAKLVSSSSLSEWHACARVRENGTQRQKGNSRGTKHGSLAHGNQNGEGADGSLEIARVAIEHGTNPETSPAKKRKTRKRMVHKRLRA